MAINRLIGFGPRNGEREPGTGELCDLPGQREYPRADHGPGSHRHGAGEGQTIPLIVRRSIFALQNLSLQFFPITERRKEYSRCRSTEGSNM